jgi:hypothetical protein
MGDRRLAYLSIAGAAVAVAGAFARRRRLAAAEIGSGAGAGQPAGQAVQSPPSAAPEGGMAAAERRPAPLETPGPSVPAPALPQSETERAEWADALRPDGDHLAETTHDPLEARVRQEEAAAAAEAAAIGGQPPLPDHLDDPAMRPVYEAGGGEAEGFEQAEDELIRNATHDDGRGKPLRDAFTPEAEAGDSTAVYGEADRIHSTERVDPDDEGRGPGIPSDSG